MHSYEIYDHIKLLLMIMNTEQFYYELSKLSKEDQLKIIMNDDAATGFAKKSNDDPEFYGRTDMSGEIFHNYEEQNYVMSMIIHLKNTIKK